VEAVAAEIGEKAGNNMLVIVKSTVPVRSCDKVERIINAALKKRDVELNIPVASNPEFLKEGTAISDFMKPDRIVVGLNKQRGEQEIRRLYRPFTLDDPSKLLVVDRKASEMIKYTANAMLATRISFMNELARLCEKLAVNIDQVRLGVGSDARIGKKFLYAGPGYGGSCFPKDVSALMSTGLENDCEMQILKAVTEVNEKQKAFTAEKVRAYFDTLAGKTICIWGLSFKPGTDDVREAPALKIVKNLLDWGAKVVAHDPEALGTFSTELGEHPNISYKNRAYEALQGADALVLMTEWGEYRWPNWDKVSELLNTKVVFDFLNQYEASMLQDLGYHYECIGRIDSKTDLQVLDQ
jgi:UDPglucose 6-dehydrogenase